MNAKKPKVKLKLTDNRSKYTGVSSHEVKGNTGFGSNNNISRTSGGASLQSSAFQDRSEARTSASTSFHHEDSSRFAASGFQERNYSIPQVPVKESSVLESERASTPQFASFASPQISSSAAKQQANLLDFESGDEEWSDFATAAPTPIPIVPLQDFTANEQKNSFKFDGRPVSTDNAKVQKQGGGMDNLAGLSMFPALISLDASSLSSNDKKPLEGMSLNALKAGRNQ